MFLPLFVIDLLNLSFFREICDFCLNPSSKQGKLVFEWILGIRRKIKDNYKRRRNEAGNA